MLLQKLKGTVTVVIICYSNQLVVSVVAIVTFGSSLFVSKNQISPFTTSKVRQRVLLGIDIVPHVVVTPINRLCGVGGS